METMLRKFCHKCGAPTKLEFREGEFDIDTGKQLTRRICSVFPCEHTGHDFGKLEHPKGIFAIFKNTTETCRRCKKTMIFEWGI
mgnify:FL=1